MGSSPQVRPEPGVVPDLRGARWRALLFPGATLGTAALASIALHVRDPHEQGSWGMCPTKLLFGIDCPGCGGLRAVNDLTNAQVVDAASSNLLFVVSLPLIAYAFARWSAGRWNHRPWRPSQRSSNTAVVVLLAAMVAFTVVRNLPFGSWLAA